MPERNPFEETMSAERAAMNVPQRTVGPPGRGYTEPIRDLGSEFGFPAREHDRPSDGFSRQLHLPEGPPITERPDWMNKPGYEPMRTGFGGGPIGGYDPNSYVGMLGKREGLRGRQRLGPSMGSGEFLSSRYGGGLDDAAGINDDARGMIEGAGFDIAGLPSDKRTEKVLWGKAVNKFPPGTPDMILQQEWERLKQIFYDKKYGGGRPGLDLPSRDDIVGLS